MPEEYSTIATNDKNYYDIADAIREKNGSESLYKPREMAAAILAIPTGGTVNNQNKSVTPSESQQSVTYDSGYTGLGTVTVGAISGTYVGSQVPRNDSSDIESSAGSSLTITASSGYYDSDATYTATNGTLTVPDISYVTSSGFLHVDYGVSTAGYLNTVSTSVEYNPANRLPTQAATTITPSESSQTAVAANKWTTGAVTVGAISSDYVGSGVSRRSSTDLTVSGAQVTAPAGYYSESASKSVATMTLPTSASSSASSGYASKATIGRSTSNQYINIPTGYNSSGAYYTISATPNGSVTAPSTISGTSATVSTGTNTLTLTKTVSVTPSVTTAGYISSGTAGNSSVSLTASVTTKAAATITPGTTDQTIASGTYLTGTQTIAGDADLTEANIKSGANIFGVAGTFTSDATATAADIVSGETAYVNGRAIEGTLVVNKYYTGSSAPSSSLGNNGDIYLQA